VHPDTRLDLALSALDAGIFTTDQARIAGVQRREMDSKIRSGEWFRVGNGVLEVAGRKPTSRDPERHAVARMGPEAVLSHMSAAAIYGLPLPSSLPELVHVTVPRNVKRPAPDGVVIHQRGQRQFECVRYQGLPLHPVPRVIMDVALTLPCIDAVVVADAALRTRRTEFGQLVEESRRHARHPRYSTLADFLPLLDPRSGSVPESRVRVGLIQAGLPRPIAQYEVWIDGRKVATVDFAWPEYKLILEVDGLRYHSADRDFRKDRVKQNELVHAGWRVLRVTALDVERMLHYVVDQVRRGLGL
jgi:hypothetical protein